MKNILVFCFMFLVNFSFAQSNVGYAKAANLDEGRSFYSVNEAIDRFVDGMNSPLLGQIYMLSISQCFKNAGMQYGGRQISDTAVLEILGWLKSHPKDMGKYAFSVYMLKEGEVYTFQTLTYENGVWVDGKQVQRRAHKGEYVLECLGQKVASSWCLNLFPSVGVVQKTAPAPDPEPEPTYEPDLEPEEEVVVIKKPKKKIVYIEEEEEEKEYIFIPKKSNREFTTLGDDYLEPSPWLLCEYCNKTIHKSWYMQHIRDHERSRRGYRDVSCNNNGLSLGEALLVSFLTPTPRYGHGHHHGGHRHNKHCGH